jgi:hypothetical protein
MCLFNALRPVLVLLLLHNHEAMLFSVVFAGNFAKNQNNRNNKFTDKV